jgi:adenosine deaminase
MKLDLHRHLEGSHSPTALAHVAERFAITDPLFYDDAKRRFRAPSDLTGALTMSGPSDDAMMFYRCITKARVAYVSEAAIAELARLAFLEAARDTDGFEMRVSLFSMTRTLLDNERVPWREMSPADFAARAERVLAGVLAARDEAQRVVVEETGVTMPMLLRIGFSRTFESESHYRALADMLRAHRGALCGLDVLGIVTGADTEPMPDALRDILMSLRSDFSDLTIHAGEFADHRSVERTLALAPQGIGHGVHSVGSDDVMARLAKDGVTLEVCPSSNQLLIPTALRALEERHGGATPLVALQRAHVHCVLGSDDPTPMGTSFTGEWSKASALGVDMGTLASDITRRYRQITGISV